MTRLPARSVEAARLAPGGRLPRSRTVPRALAPILALLLLCGGAGCDRSSEPRREIMVFAAASLEPVMQELARQFERQADVAVRLNLAGSNVLARQILAAPGVADVFVSADEAWMDEVEKAGRIVGPSLRVLLSNRLVVIAAAQSDLGPLTSLGDLATVVAGPGARRLAMADPEAVPAGRYARAALSAFGQNGGTLWDAVADEVVPTGNVRAALALVESDPDVLGVVYRSDAVSSPRVRVLWEIDPGSSPPIRYPAALVARATAADDAGGGEGDRRLRAQAFLDYLSSPAAAAVFESHGFVVPER